MEMMAWMNIEGSASSPLCSGDDLTTGSGTVFSKLKIMYNIISELICVNDLQQQQQTDDHHFACSPNTKT